MRWNEFKGWVTFFVGVSVALMITIVVVQFFGAFTSVITAPSRVISRTLETDNIIGTYERFHDRWQAYNSRLAQITAHEVFVTEETDTSERSRLRMELAAMRQSCRDLAATYNADSIKTNRSIFKGRDRTF